MPTKTVSVETMGVGRKGGGKHWTDAEVAARQAAADKLKRKRAAKLPEIFDQAIVNMREGMAKGVVQPKVAMVKVVPQLTALYLQVGRAQRMKKDYAGALETYAKIPAGDPNVEKAKVEIGMTNLEKGDLAAADTALTEASQNLSASREVFYNLGEVKFAKGETDAAMAAYQRAVDLDPKWAKPYFKLGLGKLQKADSPGAIQMMEKVIEVEPMSAEAAQAKALIEQLKKG